MDKSKMSDQQAENQIQQLISDYKDQQSPRRGTFLIFAWNDITVGKVRGNAVTAKQIINPRVQAIQYSNKLIVNLTRSGVQGIVQIDADFASVADRHEAVAGMGFHDPAGDVIC